MSQERVEIEIADHVAVVTLARPEKHNAVDVAMFDAMSVMAAGEGLDGLTEPLRGEVPNWFQRAAYDWVRVPVPVIAAVHGNCFGAGLQIALAADIRIATPDARLSVMEVKWGLIPDMSISRTLPRLVG